MLTIPAKTVYIDPEVYEKENCRKRLERMLPHVQCNDVREYDATAREQVSRIGKRRHGKDDFGDDAVIIFTTFDPNRKGWYYHPRSAATRWENYREYCQSALELNIVDGCVFRCAYCGFGRYIHFSLDVERFMQGLGDIFARYPDQRLYKYSNMTDLPPFEPELDAIPPMVRLFGRGADRYLMLFTKSDNVDFLTNLEHNGHTIISWSITCETASRLIDKRTATVNERIAAMRKMQKAGYLVRARLSPIVPIRDWKREYTELFESLFASVDPDVITLELLGWMDFDDMTMLLDPEILDTEAFESARAAADELRGVFTGPFTEATHMEVYRFCIETVKRLSPHTPVSLCHGTTPMWKALGDLMGMTPGNYVCNCGPMSTPGGELYDQFHPDSHNAGRMPALPER